MRRIAWSGQQKPGQANEVGTAVLTLEEPVVAGEAGECPAVAKRALWSGTGFVQTRMRHERATPVGGQLGLGKWNAGY